jgi:ATP-dependent RNA helicase SUPV3L1/SUV3
VIEINTNLKACVVYGGLPPETRKAQALMFNDENSGYDVLVASDAVGLGLNLNIRRIIFNQLNVRFRKSERIFQFFFRSLMGFRREG